MRARRIVPAGASLALAGLSTLVLVSCGGGGSSAATTSTTSTTSTSSTTSTTRPITKSDYVAQANALCATLHDNEDPIQDEIGRLLTSGSGRNKGADAWDQMVQLDSDTLAKLRALPRPAGDEATLDAIFATFDTAVSDETQLVAALRADDQTTLDQLQTKGPADRQAAADAFTQYGLLCP